MSRPARTISSLIASSRAAVSRAYATEAVSPAPAASTSSYPFNPSALHASSPAPSNPPPHNLLHPRKGWSLLIHLNNAHPPSPWAPLFARRGPERVKTGSILTVVNYLNSSRTACSSFSGVLMGVYRGGVDTSFRLRNIVNKVGVEMKFKLNSPMIKDIKIVYNAEKGKRIKGRIRDLRRAKVNYLRDRPAMMNTIAKELKRAKKADLARAEEETAV